MPVTDKWNFMKLKILCIQRKYLREELAVERNAIFANHISDRED